MVGRQVDVVSLGPPPVDPYDPSATAWALAGAMAARGDDVRVIRPEGAPNGTPIQGVATVEVPVPHRRPGAAADHATFASSAGRRVRRAVDLIVRDPAGLGALGAPGRTRGRPPIVAFVRSVEVRAFDQERAGLPGRGWAGRLDRWRDRRSVRRLERAALLEADVLFADAPGLGSEIAREYAVPEPRVRASVPPVAALPLPASRDVARGSLELPRDVPVAVTPVADAVHPARTVDRAREAFRRIRPLFPGARLVVVGGPAPNEPGVVDVPGREPSKFGLALAAANVALFPEGRAAFDPLVIGAMRAGCAVAAVPAVRLPIDPGGALRYAAGDDAGELASTLAELFADPALVRTVAEAGRAHAALYAPARILEAMDAATAETAR